MTATLKERRLVQCPSCGHQGLIDRAVPTHARLRCCACGEQALVREATGPRPCPPRRKGRAAAAKAAAAINVLQRYGGELPEDTVTDLWR